MKSRILVFILILILIFTSEIYTTITFAETNEEYEKELEMQVVLLEERITSLEEQCTLYEKQIILLEDFTQMQDSEIDNLWKFIRTTKDYQDLSRIVEAESGGEPFEGKLQVASVVINRVDYGFAKTVHDVIYQPGQFEPVENGRFENIKVSKESIVAADEIIKYGSISDALFFMNPRLSSEKSRTWMRTLTYIATVGNHEFYRW